MASKRDSPVKKSIFDIIESYYAAHLLIHLNNKGIFKEPRKKRLIKTYFQNPAIFKFLSSRTDIIVPVDARYFTINPKYSSYMELGFHIEKFLQAYGEVNTDGKQPSIVINEKKFADSFQHAATFYDPGAVLNIFSMLQAQTVLDLGCGTGSFIVHFCKKNKLNKAFGIDQNPYLQRVAAESISKNRLTGRARLVKGSVVDFDKLLSASALAQVDAVYASSILNEFFYSPGELVKLLKKMKKAFPGKFLVVVDYYGSFNTREANNKDLQHNYVHDVMQILTGQGVPPKNYKEWNEYYAKAKCNLLHVHEGRSNGIKWFIHIVKLGDR